MDKKTIAVFCLSLGLSGCYTEVVNLTIDGKHHTLSVTQGDDPDCSSGCRPDNDATWAFDGQDLPVDPSGKIDSRSPFSSIWAQVLANMSAWISWDIYGNPLTTPFPPSLNLMTGQNGQYVDVPQQTPAPTTVWTTAPPYDPNFWTTPAVTTPPTINTTTSGMTPSN